MEEAPEAVARIVAGKVAYLPKWKGENAKLVNTKEALMATAKKATKKSTTKKSMKRSYTKKTGNYAKN